MTFDSVSRWRGRAMLDPAGAMIGTIQDIYFDEETEQPGWALVATDRPPFRLAFVPIEAAEEVASGVSVAYDRATVHSAPGLGQLAWLWPHEQLQLYRHYGLCRPTLAHAAVVGSPVEPQATSRPRLRLIRGAG